VQAIVELVHLGREQRQIVLLHLRERGTGGRDVAARQP
jgi:hypothetical protein